MYKKIVVGTDGSDTANAAVQHAASLAALCGATLHVVHAYQSVSALASMGPDAGAAALASELREAVARDAGVLTDRAAEQARRSGIEVESHVRTGDPAGAIIDVAEAVGADLVVIGNKGMSGVRRFVLGSVPNKVAHHCPCNVLIVSTS